MGREPWELVLDQVRDALRLQAEVRRLQPLGMPELRVAQEALKAIEVLRPLGGQQVDPEPDRETELAQEVAGLRRRVEELERALQSKSD